MQSTGRQNIANCQASLFKLHNGSCRLSQCPARSAGPTSQCRAPPSRVLRQSSTSRPFPGTGNHCRAIRTAHPASAASRDFYVRSEPRLSEPFPRSPVAGVSHSAGNNDAWQLRCAARASITQANPVARRHPITPRRVGSDRIAFQDNGRII